MMKILNNDYYDLFIQNLLIPTNHAGDDITPLTDHQSLLHVSKKNMDRCDLGFNQYHLFPTLYTLNSELGYEIDSKPQPMKYAQTDDNQTLNLYGQGVIIGIVDTGIDYRHPVFLNNDKTTRILSIWDQTNQEGTPPKGFTFGSEYTKAAINQSLVFHDPLSMVPVTDTNGHGTAIASIIAGSQQTTPVFRGVVPNANIAVVKLKEAKQNLKDVFCIPEDKLCFQESDIILGVRYLTQLAKKLKRPIVLCIALGSSQGDHDGRGILSNYLNELVQLPDIGISVSAGNEGNNNRHYYNQTLYPPFIHEFQLRVGLEETMFSMEIWPNIPSRLSIQIINPNQEIISRIEPSFDDCIKKQFQLSEGIVWINNMAFERGSGNQLILLRFVSPTPGIWQFRLISSDNSFFSFNAWLPSQNLITDGTYFLRPDPNTTITAPGNTRRILTVSAYKEQTEQIVLESSRGYTRTDLVKPDLAAPGYLIPCAIPDNKYGTLTGTGAAAAYAAGVIAIVFEWTQGKGNFTYITGEQINQMLVRTAMRSVEYRYPNNIWGYGIINYHFLLRRLSELL
ncbi:S8 family peptidase [Clostridium sp. E02]|uniref:S8 family peptidase n=1 Tax=Clostridium sp. E02 TaxID=2487134 RepID=UPI000F51C176|nr:S8 family peptidase [Clostridium sp. E02]